MGPFSGAFAMRRFLFVRMQFWCRRYAITSPLLAVILRKRSRSLTNDSQRRIYSFSPQFYYLYILTIRSKTIYAGVTGNLERRIFECKHGLIAGFTSRHKIDRSVYFECFGEHIQSATAGKAVKALLRVKKMSSAMWKGTALAVPLCDAGRLRRRRGATARTHPVSGLGNYRSSPP